jgi:DNA-binding CsgD family transcriptional regulator
MHIADQTVISPRTVNTHLTSIYVKIQDFSCNSATRYTIVPQPIYVNQQSDKV